MFKLHLYNKAMLRLRDDIVIDEPDPPVGTHLSIEGRLYQVTRVVVPIAVYDGSFRPRMTTHYKSDMSVVRAMLQDPPQFS